MSNLHQAEDSDEAPQCSCCDARTGLSILVAIQVLSFGYKVYRAISSNAPTIVLGSYGVDILLIISGIIGLVLQRHKWILTYGILSLISLIVNVCVTIYHWVFAPVRSTPYGEIHGFPESIQWPTYAVYFLLNAWILAVTFRYYQFLRNRETSQKGQV
jgi:hypothetical protein